MISILLPLYFTYKSLRTSSSPLLIPWLQYWSTLSLLLLLESYIPILPWLPFYGTIRLFFLLYLVLPQTQGARYIYTSYIELFLVENESRIDRLIADTHQKLRENGLDYIWQAVEWVRTNVLRMQSSEPMSLHHRPPPRTAESYVSNLLTRFTAPYSSAAGAGATSPPAGDFYNLLSSAAATLGINPTSGSSSSTATARDAQIDSLARSGALVPPHLKSVGERADFVALQREKLRVLLGALDKEAGELEMQRDVERRVSGGPGGLSKSRSEGDFERVERDEASNGGEEGGKEVSGVSKGEGSGSGGWFGWIGGGGGGTAPVGKMGKDEGAEGRSSGVET